MANVLIKLFILVFVYTALGTIVFVTGTTLSHLNTTTTNGLPSSSHPQSTSSHHHHDWSANHNVHHEHDQTGRHNYTWSEWYDWSTCSRPCGGGISISLRKCLSRSVCIGDAHRYRICNMHDCSHPTDYRALQCSAFNSRPFRDRFYEWEPYIDPVDPCSLTCKAKGVSFVAKLASIVKDGTRCRDTSLDMCVAGKCLSVGCDLQLGSLARLDECGICGGDGSSCSSQSLSSSSSSSSSASSSLFSWTHRFLEPCSVSCGGGLQHSEVVCANTETGTFVSPDSCLGLDKPSPTQQPCNIHRCPPTWRVGDWSECSKKCGVGHRSRRVECHQHINGTHRILPDLSCIQNEKPDSEQRCNEDDCPQWFAGSWGKCSQNCGSGIQHRDVNCRDSTGQDSTECELELKPLEVRECSDYSDCPSDEEDQEITVSAEPSYSIGEWSSCNVSCGHGAQTRTVQCRIYLAFSKSYRLLPDDQCPGTVPIREQKCHVDCPLVARDEENEITDDSDKKFEKAIAAMMKKTFDNVDNEEDNEEDDMSDLANSDPTGNENTANNRDSLYRWEPSGFTECSQLCLGGVQETRFVCLRQTDNSTVDSSFCDIESKPDSYTRTCNDHPCPPKWEVSEYSACNKLCGRGGVRLRQVRCVHQVARGNRNVVQVDDSKCQEAKPKTKEFCNQIDCPARWIAAAWTKCSKDCGRGMKTRKIRCMKETAFDGIKEASIRDCPVRKPRVFKTCNLKSCKFGENVIHTYHFSDSDGSRKAKRNNNALWVNKYTQEKVILKVEGKAIIYEGSLVKLRCPDWKEPMDYELKLDTKLRWAKNNIAIEADENHYMIRNVLKLRSVKLNDTGVYKCQLEDDTVHSMFLHVIEKPRNEPVSINDESTSATIDEKSPTKAQSPPTITTSQTNNKNSIEKFESNSIFDLESSESSERRLTLDEGNFKNLKFNWITTQWSECTVKCGGIGFRMRLVQCYVQFENITEKVQNQFCLDAGMKQPKNIETCGFASCYRWQTTPWSECLECRSYNRASQTRQVSCVAANGTAENDSKCPETGKPEAVRDCFNPQCVPQWKAGDWSECNSFGEKSRTVTCVWQATGKPVTIHTTVPSNITNHDRDDDDDERVDGNNSDDESKIGSECNRYDAPSIIEHCLPSATSSAEQVSSNVVQSEPSRAKHHSHHHHHHHKRNNNQDLKIQNSANDKSLDDNREGFTFLDSSLV